MQKQVNGNVNTNAEDMMSIPTSLTATPEAVELVA